jgi:hypothetical protein
MSAAHTPTPWSLLPARGLSTPQFEPPRIVAEPYPYLHIATVEFPVHTAHGDAIETAHPDAVMDANAAFIVKACNAHNELIAALEEIDRIALSHPYAAMTCGEVANIARAALARAKGEA